MAKRKPGKQREISYPAPKPKPPKNYGAAKTAKTNTGKSRSWNSC